MIRIGHEDDGHEIASASGAIFNPHVDVVIARADEDGKLMGGALYQDYTGPGGSMTIHVAGFAERWVNRDMLWICFDYPFDQLSIQRLYGRVKSTNERALEFDRKLGFKEVYREEGVFPDADLVVMRMLKDECRHLALKPKTVKSNLQEA